MRNRRVLQVLEGLDIGGKEIFAMNFYRNIDKEKVQFDFAVNSNEIGFFEPEIQELGGKVFHYSNNSSVKSGFAGFINNMYSFYRFIRIHKYSVVHIHGCSFFAILTASIPCKLCGVKNIIAHAHNPGMPSGGKLDSFLRKVLKYLIAWSCNYYFTCSDIAAESKYPKFVLNEKLTYIHNAIELNKFRFSEFDRKQIRGKYNIKNDEIVLGIIGRLEEQKNHEYLINVFDKLNSVNRKYKLLIVGAGSLERKLKKQVKELGLESRVIFVGNTSEPSKFYSAMDIFLLPSLYEGFPFVLIEAQASGLPCVISKKITKSVCLLESTKQIGIETSDVLQWVEVITNISVTQNRENAVEILKKQGFEIEDESKHLQEIYLGMKG